MFLVQQDPHLAVALFADLPQDGETLHQDFGVEGKPKEKKFVKLMLVNIDALISLLVVFVSHFYK